MAGTSLPAHHFVSKLLCQRTDIPNESWANRDGKESPVEVLPDDFFGFLEFWLVSHIQGVDTKCAG